MLRPWGRGGAAHTLVQTPALPGCYGSPREIGQRSALTGQGSAPCHGRVTILPPDPNLSALRQVLARLRAEQGWSYDQLAERSGLSRRTVIEIEQGRTIGTLATWHALAHAFNVPLATMTEALCEGHEPPQAAPA